MQNIYSIFQTYVGAQNVTFHNLRSLIKTSHGHVKQLIKSKRLNT